ncbi:MAG: nucleotidyltransferase family protein [Oscillospiraceae bacterium]|nr:nucleotidyltransferase family protein [Oscillospiraceae bacterium]
MITGIICEYNPLHLGHKKQIDLIRAQDPEGGIVCLMSGNFVQRGQPAIFHKSLRAEAAVRCGADLVLELPVTYALSSAEGFAAGGVSLLSGFCHNLCFGGENADGDAFLETAKLLLSEAFPEVLRTELDKGLSFPAARENALQSLGGDAALIASPNNILGVEYCKAILQQGSQMHPMPILREGNYHDTAPDTENPSATAVRQLISQKEAWQDFVPDAARNVFKNAPTHTIAAGERAILARLRCMTEEEFEALPYGSEGLWRKLMHSVRNNGSLEEILTATKSKRYTRSRLDRMVMCAFLGIDKATLETPVPYARVLAFNDRGREILKVARTTGNFPNIGEQLEDSYQQLENRCGDLYGLFCEDAPEIADAEFNCRIYYHKT